MWNSDNDICAFGLRGCCILKPYEEQKIINLPVRSVVISCDTQNTLARVSSTLVYTNDTPDTLECDFVFPLDARSAVYHFQAEIDGRVIVAEVQERKEAEETYERAIEAQQTAFLLEQDERSSDTFRIRVGNLPSHGELRVSLKYVLELDVLAALESESSSAHSGAILGLTLPTVLNPRYDPHPEQSSFSKEVLLTANPYTFAFTVHIAGSMRIDNLATGITGVTYATQFADKNHTKATATLSLPEGHKHREKDLQLRIHYVDAFEPHVVYEKGEAHKTTQASTAATPLSDTDVVLLNFLPKLSSENVDEPLEDAKNEFIFVIDRSGSMDGTRIVKAKETLLLLLKSLPIGCHFQMVGFGSEFSSVFPVPAPYDEEHLKTALDYQAAIEADMGGTEVLEPLKDIFSKSVTPGFARQIFLITDGDVGNTDEIISLAKKNRHNSRIFTVGIGEGASTALVRGVAQAAGGRAEFVLDEEAAFATKILALLRDASLPRFSDVQVECHVPHGVSVWRLPSELNSIFEGHFVNIFLVLKGELARLDVEKAQVTLRGKVLERPLSFTLSFSRHSAVATSLGQESGADQLVHRLAAKCHIEELTVADAKAEEIVAISKAFNLASKHTSFVGVDKASKVTSAAPRRRPPSHPSSAWQGQVRDSFRKFPVHRSVSQPSACEPKRSKRCDIIMDIQWAEPSSSSSVGRRKLSSSEYLECEDDSDESSDNAPPSSPQKTVVAPPPPARAVPKTVTLASLQTFNGSWKADEMKLWETLGMDRNVLMKEKPSSWNEDEFMTVLVLAYLQLRLDQEKGEWILFAQKAIKWINGLRGKSEVTALIDALKAKISLFPTA